MATWDIIKEVSAVPVRKEANKLFLLALVGDPEQVELARREVMGPATPEEEAAAAPFLMLASSPYTPEEVERLRHADLIVSLPGGPGLTEFRPADTVKVAEAGQLCGILLEHAPELRVAFARRLPGFRRPAAESVIREVARANAEFAAVAGIGSAIPALIPIFPALATADVLMLTKNQVVMVFRLAAIYGETLDFRSRAREVMSVIGGAFGWRSLARSGSALLPGAVGLPFRVGVAYSGTYAVGRAAQMVFDEGRRPTRQEMVRIYDDATVLARGAVAAIKDRVKNRKSLKADTPALPDGTPAEVPAEAAEQPVERIG